MGWKFGIAALENGRSHVRMAQEPQELAVRKFEFIVVPVGMVVCFPREALVQKSDGRCLFHLWVSLKYESDISSLSIKKYLGFFYPGSKILDLLEAAEVFCLSIPIYPSIHPPIFLYN